MQKIENSHFVDKTSLRKILTYCSQSIFNSAKLRKIVIDLTSDGSIPVYHQSNYNAKFVTTETEFQIRNMFKNFAKLESLQQVLIPLSQKENYDPITYLCLDRLLQNHGERLNLTHDDVTVKHLGRVEQEGVLVPVIPYVTYTPKGKKRFLTSIVWNELLDAIDSYQKQHCLRAADWSLKLAKHIKYKHLTL